jgi:hypothetical protein
MLSSGSWLPRPLAAAGIMSNPIDKDDVVHGLPGLEGRVSQIQSNKHYTLPL